MPLQAQHTQKSLVLKRINRYPAQPTFSGDLVHKCLMSMPFRSDLAENFIEEYRKYVQFHSTIDILKDPPSTYPIPGVDLMAGLDWILNKARNNEYSSQFEFDSDITKLILSVHDDHLDIYMCSTTVFQFTNNMALVSVSSDGIELPRVYTWHDAELQHKGEKNVSPVESIDGIDVEGYLEKLASGFFYPLSSARDPDALYNSLFPSHPRSLYTSTKETGAWAQNLLWPGSSHTLRFTNGTSLKMATLARFITPPDTFNYRNGASLFEKLCLDTDLAFTPITRVRDPKFPQDTLSAYPTPFVNSSYHISGYFPKLSNDTAVLVVPTFKPDNPVEFSDIAKAFISNASALHKRKIIIDLSSNGGGFLQSAIDLFRIFFPTAPVYTAARYRAHDGLNLITKALNDAEQEQRLDNFGLQSVDEAVKPDQKTGFSSWKDLYVLHLDLAAAGYQTAVNASRDGTPKLSPNELSRYNHTVTAVPAAEWSLVRSANLNIENMFIKGDDQLPLQFVYEPADCRRFFTMGQYLQQDQVWDEARKVGFDLI
ncbi:uncharacterized protein ATNIH1004_010673 [Aspergillus tanneri]|uniref:Uncharacterized protein n=1 Tax=Aspergillus tanneri TaxID=1220188 RepID=A0A5M9M8S5_9EURO|nr:uncharacterized protein ATNIH1004_010673 [Aspergillus tanneri]KAA8641734.1 hypothetical protein ATNIH1004_010673 [Aspergillus tanneri]